MNQYMTQILHLFPQPDQELPQNKSDRPADWLDGPHIQSTDRRSCQRGDAWLFIGHQGLFLPVYVVDIEISGMERSLEPTWLIGPSELIMRNLRSSWIKVTWECTQRECKPNKKLVDEYRQMFESRISAGATEKLPDSEKRRANATAWSYDTEEHERKCVERHCALANENIEQFYKVSTPCIDDHQLKKEEWDTVEELSEVCSQVALRFLYLARSGRPDILCFVNQLARTVMKWTRARDRRLARVISHILCRSDNKPHCHVANIAQQCRFSLFQDSHLGRDLEDSKSMHL